MDQNVHFQNTEKASLFGRTVGAYAAHYGRQQTIISEEFLSNANSVP